MHKCLIVIILAFLVGCNNGERRNNVGKSVDSISILQNRFVDGDISDAEASFLRKLKAENPEILIGAQVTRLVDKNEALVYSKLNISDKTLAELGYVYYNLIIWGKLEEEVEVFYSYSTGLANVVYGSAIGGSIENYVHTRVGYGTTAKSVSVYSNGVTVSKTILPISHSDVDSTTENW